MDLPKILGRNVREARHRAGLSQEQLAFEAGMKRSYVSDLERGTRNPSVKAIARLAAALKVSPSELLRE
jgi:transcriptional regulator with XRE-family HTH domain